MQRGTNDAPIVAVWVRVATHIGRLGNSDCDAIPHVDVERIGGCALATCGTTRRRRFGASLDHHLVLELDEATLLLDDDFEFFSYEVSGRDRRLWRRD